MADARLYIVNEDTGMACRFYSRLGNGYSLGTRDGFVELLAHTSHETATSDRFFIVDGDAAVERIEGSSLWRFTGKSPLPPDPFDNPLRDEVTAMQREIEALKNRVATLGRKLISAGGHE